MANVTELGTAESEALGWVIIRVDGKGFTKFTQRHYVRPHDILFHQQMAGMAEAVLGELDLRYALVGSDEASFLGPSSGSVYGGRMPKLATVASGLATKHFIGIAHRGASFDAKVFRATDPRDCWGYVKQRQDSIRRNAVGDALYHLLTVTHSTRAAERLVSGWGWEQRVTYLQAHGVTLESIGPMALWGSEVGWETFTRRGRNPITNKVADYTRRKVVRLVNEGGALTLLRGVAEIYDRTLENPHENYQFDPASGRAIPE